MKAGRNDPCPCGSGKKYKKCCLLKEEPRPAAAALDEPPDVRRMASSALMRFASSPEHAKTFAAAFREFYAEIGPGLADDAQLADDEQVKFTSYLLFDHTLEDGRTLAETFLQRGSGPVRAAEQRMIRRWTRTCLRPYEVEDVVREQGLRLRNLWNDETVFVTERAATLQLTKWDLLVARVAPEDDGTLRFEGGLYVLPSRIKQRLVDTLREEERRLRRVDPGLGEEAFFKRCAPLFHRIWRAEAAPRPMPTLVTAEGDPMVFGKVVFDVFDRAAVAAALDGHADLSREEDGEYAWLEEADDGFTRSLGHIVLEEGRLVLEVTSRQRADRGRHLIEECGGTALRHRATQFEGVEKALERHASKPREPIPAGIPPEVAAQLVLEYKERHYATWPDEPLPALDGKTPRAAARSKKLTPRLMDLLKEMENMESRAERPDNPAYDFGRLWSELGLERPR